MGDDSVIVFVASDSYRFLCYVLEEMSLNILLSFNCKMEETPLIINLGGT